MHVEAVSKLAPEKYPTATVEAWVELVQNAYRDPTSRYEGWLKVLWFLLCPAYLLL